MSSKSTTPQWRQRLDRIDSPVESIRFPELKEVTLDQDEEWCEVVIDGKPRRVRFHDYDKIYRVPGLYEKLFYDRLECNSPERVVGLLEDVISDVDDDIEQMRVLDVGAGNGIVGEELASCGADKLFGIDIIPEAKDAALRDRPDVYDGYMVADLTDFPEQLEERLRRDDLNCLTTVAALGYGDIPPRAFIKALDMISTPGWLAFNIKEDFIAERDNSGFCKLIRQLSKSEVIQIQAYRRYRHRLSLSGEPLHYVGMVARKLRDVPDRYLQIQ